MSQTYTDLDLTKFPEEIDALSGFADPSHEQLVKILSYETLLRNGDYEGAEALLTQNPELAGFQITASKLNRHEQMIVAIERMFKADIDAYIKAAKDGVTSELQADVNDAKNTASSAVEKADAAVKAANLATEKVSGTVRVVAQGALVFLPAGWVQEGDLFVQTVELDEMTTENRMRYTLTDSAIGNVFIAGVTCPENGKVKVLCFSQPAATFGIRYAVEEVNS